MKPSIKEAKEKHDLKVLAVKEILTRSEVMAFYDVSYNWIGNQMKRGFPNFIVGGNVRFSKGKIDNWFLQQS